MLRRISLIAALMILVALIVACAAAEEATPTSAPAAATPTKAAPTATPVPKPKLGGILRWGTNHDTYGIDPAARRVSYGGSGRAAREIYNGLIQYDPETQKLLPELATEWSISPDGKEITFKLRPGVKFHDGTPFNAETVRYHFERLTGITDPKKAGRFARNYEQLEKVEIVDDLTVKFMLKKPQASLMNFLGDPSGFIPSPTAVEKLGPDYQRNPVGTGPMKVKEWTKDVMMVLEKNPDYWEKDKDGTTYPYLDGITVTIIPDNAVRVVNLKAGQVDYIEEVPEAQVASLKKEASLRFYQKTSFGMETLYLRYGRPPFDKRACREAFIMAIDKKGIAASVYGGVHTPSETIISPANAYFDPNTKGLPYDLEKAKEKLAECGKPDGFDAEIITMNLQRVVTRMEAIQASVAKIGINLKVTVVEIAAMRPLYDDEDKGDGRALYEGSYSDPLQFVGQFRCNQPGNAERMCEPELEKLVDASDAVFDFDKRKAALQEVAKYTSHTPLMLPIVHLAETVAASPKVKGIRMGPQLMQHFKWVWLEE